MAGDLNNSRVLLSVPNEVEAAGIVTALAAYDIWATTTGGFTSGFRAEAPGYVQVIVKQADLDRAKRALAEIQGGEAEVDWSKVDVGKPAEPDQPTE